MDFTSRLQDRIEDLSNLPTSSSMLQAIREKLGLRNVVYLALHVPPVTRGVPFVETTYSEAWVKHYFDRRYFEIDPVVKQSMKTILPTDWSTLDRSSPRIAQMFDEAAGGGVGQQGLSVPIRGPNGERALFSLTADFSASDWPLFKREMMPLIQMLAHHVHQNFLLRHKIVFDDPQLSKREAEVLEWAANGKSVDDIGMILGISKHTVKSHLELCRFKLRGLNTAHAVARALQKNLIAPPL